MKFLLGFGIGAALGLLLAPAAGKETRARLSGKARSVMHASEERIEEKMEQAAGRAEARAGDIGGRIGREAAQAAVRAVSEEVLGEKKDRTA